MTFIKLHKQPKSEDKNIHPFLKHYCKEKDVKGDVKYEAISEDIDGRTPDYYVDTINALVEVKEVHDKEDRAQSAQWGKIVDNLRKQINKNKKLEKVKGLYSIRTPASFKFPTNKKQIKEAANDILDAVIAGRPSVTVQNVTFKLERVRDKNSGIYFSAGGLGGSFDPAHTIHENIRNKLAIVNEQLGFEHNDKKIETRILLLSNQYPLLHFDWDLYKALSFSYEQLLGYKNIDEIWFQNPQKDGSYTHDLLYTRDFLQGVHNQQLTINDQNAQLFASWFSALEKLGDAYKQPLFNVLHNFLEEKRPHEWFENTTAREEMVRLGICLADNGRYDDVVWLIKQFIDDPDPQEPKDYSRDPKFNYHQQIVEGEDPHIITTVLGHLAWVVQKLATQGINENKKYTLQAFKYAQELVSHKNYYVKLQSITPLVEIAKRRQWLSGYGKRHRNGKRIKNSNYSKYHETVFNLVKIVEDNRKCVAIAKWLTHIFAYFKDLNTQEALKVLNALKVTSESAGLFVYFGIYRKNHYQDQDIEFDGEKLREVFTGMIRNKDSQYSNLRGSISWHLWKLLDENPDEFDNEDVQKAIELFLEQPYQKNTHKDIARIIEDWADKKPDICIDWFEIYLNGVYNYIKNNKNKARNVWLTPEKIIEIAAKNRPEKLTPNVHNLVRIWKLGAYIGSPKRIFETFKMIENNKLKKETKNKFKNWYKEMKRINPKLKEVIWEEV